MPRSVELGPNLQEDGGKRKTNPTMQEHDDQRWGDDSAACTQEQSGEVDTAGKPRHRW